MKKTIGLLVILVLATGLLTSCFKAKYYGSRTTVTGGNTINVTSSNGIPTNINFAITQTQYVKGASFEIKASNAIPVKLEAPDEPINVQAKKPFHVKIEPDGIMQAHVKVDEIPVKLVKDNLDATITLKLDPSFKGLLPSTIAMTGQPIQFSWDTNLNHTNYIVSPAQFVLPESTFWPAIGWLFLIGLAGLFGRAMGWLFIPHPVERLTRNFEGLIVWLNLDAKTALLLDLIAGFTAALLVPAFMRMFPGSIGVTALDATSQRMTVLSFALLAGMLGVEFIRGMIELWQVLVAKLASKGKSEKNLQNEIAVLKDGLGKARRGITRILRENPPPPKLNKASLRPSGENK